MTDPPDDSRARAVDPLADVEWAPAVIEAALDAIVTIESTGRVVQFNPAAEGMFGYSREEALGQTLADLVIPAELQAAHWAGLLRLVAGERPRILDRRLQLRALRKDGSEFPIELTVTRTGHSPALFTGFVRDCSNLRDAVGRGVRVEQRLVAAEELGLLGSWELDIVSRVAHFSDELSRIHGLDPEAGELSLESYLEMVHPEDVERVTEIIERAVAALGPEDEEVHDFRIVRPDGAIREMRAAGRIERDELGRAVRWVGSGQDVTDQRRSERALRAHRVVDQALDEWHSFDEDIDNLLGRLAAALEYPVGSLWVRGDDGMITCRAFCSEEGIETPELERVTYEARFPPGRAVPGRAWAEGRPVTSDDLASHLPPVCSKAAQDIGLRSALAFPAVGQSGPLAVFSFLGFSPYTPDERFTRVLDGIGQELGRFLDRRRAQFGPDRLSRRELQIIRLAADGNTGPDIAAILVVSPATVKTHFENIYAKLGVRERAGAVAYAMRCGLIE